MTSTRSARVTLLVVLPATGLLLAACSSAPRQSASSVRPCRGAPVDSMFLAGMRPYAECDVDRAATMIGRPQVMSSGASAGGSLPACASAEVEFVVDEKGVPRTDRIRAVRYSSTAFLDEVKASVATLRYRPAIKDGQPVPQVVRFGMTRGSVVVRSSGGSGLPAAPRQRRPNC